jgi:hypothetical protein
MSAVCAPPRRPFRKRLRPQGADRQRPLGVRATARPVNSALPCATSASASSPGAGTVPARHGLCGAHGSAYRT